MKLTNFDDFWNEHKNDYIEHAKQLALSDFKSLNTKKNGKFICQFWINSDDDFSFVDDSFSFSVYGNTKKELLKNTIDFLLNLKLTPYSEFNKYKWEWLRDETITRLRKGETDISFGGNQEIYLSLSENKPTTTLKKQFK